ncbi:MAG TPA: adenylyltransferase/cytidyltransferase family protein [Phycisphaerae bacterium]|jgi:rfaE bifunctional protein nucleotidyltransferase chain/domain
MAYPTQGKTRHSYHRKIVDLQTLCQHREQARRGGKTVVHCHGCFDIVHPGHIRYLQFARQQGDVLVVSLTGDPHVGKGEGRPYVPEELRAENLAALEFVDYVYINPTQTAVELLGALRPDIYIKGREYEHNTHPGFMKERQTVEACGGRVIFSSGDVVYSSSHIIDNYAQRLDLEQEKLALFCKRYNIGKTPLLNIIDAVVDRPFVVLGDVVLDRYQYCDATDIAADGPMMSLVPLEHRDYLGGAAMIARHLAGLGAEATLLASLGTDDASDAAIDDLEAAGVHVLPIRNRKKIATRTRFVVDTQKLFTLDESPVIPTDSGNERYILEQVKKLGGTGGDGQTSLVMYDAGLGLFTDSLAASVLAAARDGEKGGTYGSVCGGTAGSRGRLARMRGSDLLVATERAIRVLMRDHEQGISALAYRTLNDLKSKALFTPLGKKGLLAFDQREAALPGEAWEGKLRSEYLASPLNGTIDRLGSDEAMLAIAAGMLGGGANIHQAAYVALAAAILESRQMGHQPLDGHTLRELLESRPELGE